MSSHFDTMHAELDALRAEFDRHPHPTVRLHILKRIQEIEAQIASKSS